MNRSLRRLIAALVLGTYGLAVTVSGAFHSHFRAACQSCEVERESKPHCCGLESTEPLGCSTQGESSSQPADESDASEIGAQAEDCAVCSFLAQKPIPLTSPVAVFWIYSAQKRVTLKAIARVEEPFSAVWSRGPPPVA